MKKLMKLFSLTLVIAVLVLSLAACGGDGKPVIGVIQFGSHGSLNNCYDGVIAGLQEAGIDLEKYDVQRLDSNFDPSVSKTQANTLVNKNADVIIAIATPSAVAAADAAADKDVPVVFCAVTDPTVMENYSNVTGSSDVPNFEKQLEVVTAFMGKKDLKIGVMYSTDESSSPFMITKLKEAAAAYAGMEILDKAVADITTIDTVTKDLLNAGVDCFVNILDNTIVGKLESNILPLTNEKKVPVFGSEIEQVKVGCAASASIEYIDVGKAAGKAAADILGGTKADAIPVATITTPTNFYNSVVCASLGLKVPTSITATDVAAK